MVHPRGEGARNPYHQWAEEVYGTFVGNLERRLAAFAKVERDFEEAESDFKAANAAPVTDEAEREEYTFCVFHLCSAVEQRMEHDHAVKNLLFAIQDMTVHHRVMVEDVGPVVLSLDQQKLVRGLHAAQAEFFWSKRAYRPRLHQPSRTNRSPNRSA